MQPQIDPQVFDLYDAYCHGDIGRHEFLGHAAALTVAGGFGHPYTCLPAPHRETATLDMFNSNLPLRRNDPLPALALARARAGIDARVLRTAVLDLQANVVYEGQSERCRRTLILHVASG
jgi:hypothetical protein